MSLICWITTRRCRVTCDHCNTQFEICRARFLSRPFHFCSNACRHEQQKLGGLINERFKETCKTQYGVDNPMQNDDIKFRSINTRSSYDDDTKEQKRKRAQDKSLKKIGYKHHWAAPEIRQKVKKTHVERFGVEHSMQSNVIKEKARKTCEKNHGVPYGVVTSNCRRKTIAKVTQVKKHESRKKNKTYARSNIENTFFDELKNVFENVERNVQINGWEIDFYVESANVYVQFDGIYYHGLDRPIEAIKQHKYPIDKIIETTYYRDIEQTKWFETNGLKLIRFTDKEFKEWQKENEKIRKMLLERLTLQVS